MQLDVDIHNTSRFSLKLTAPSHQSKFQHESSFAARCKAQIVQEDGKNVHLKDVYRYKYLPCTVSCFPIIDVMLPNTEVNTVNPCFLALIRS